MKLSHLGEFGLIEKIHSHLLIINKSSIIQGIEDDAAIIKIPLDKHIVATIDTLIEDVHFSMEYYSFYDLGWKSLAVNLSDIAAMGAAPKYALVSLGLPSKLNLKNIDEFYRGMRYLQKKYSVDVIGGDTVNSKDKINVTIALLGEVNPGKALFRKGAKVGDLILATGEFGVASPPTPRGTRAKRKWGEALKHRRPQPRIIEGQIIALSGGATAMMDDSDGLARSIHEICRQSKVGASIFENEIPIAKNTDIKNALNAGEDFELIFTCEKVYAEKIIRNVKRKTGTQVSIIGEIVNKKSGINIISANGKLRKLEVGGYEHFRK